MNMKVLLLLCLVFFATTLITSVANRAMTSLASLHNTINGSNRAILDDGSIEPESLISSSIDARAPLLYSHNGYKVHLSRY